MATRREFVKAAIMVPLAGLTVSQTLSHTLNDPATGHASDDPVYAGRPLSYWLARVSNRNHDRDVSDIAEQWLFRHFGDAAVPGLIEAMRSDCWFHAETELVMIGTPATVRALTQALKDDDPRVRHGAASAMFGIGRYKARQRPELLPVFREAFPVLTEVLKADRDEQVATISAWVLFGFTSWMAPDFSLPVQTSDYASPTIWAQVVRRYSKHFPVQQVVPRLISLLGNDDATTRLKAAQALSKFDPDHPGIEPIFVEHVIGREYISGLDFHGLDRIVEKALPTLRQRFRSGTAKTRVSILHALAWSRSSLILPTLAEGLVDEAWEVRAEATHGLSFIYSSETVPLLIQTLQDPDRHVRKNARWVLANNEHLAAKALPDLLKLVEDGDPVGRMSAALTLLDLDKETERALAVLLPTLDRRELSVRLESAISIAKFEPDRNELVPILVEGVEGKEHDLRNAAVAALEQMGRNAATVLPRIISRIRQPFYSRERLFGLIAGLGPDATLAVPHLIDLMKDREVGRDVPKVLGSIGKAAISSLKEATRSSDRLVQSRAVRGLGYLGDAAQTVVPMLIKLLRSEAPVLRIAAADALGDFGPAAALALPVLMETYRDCDIGVRVHAHQAMSRIQGGSTA